MHAFQQIGRTQEFLLHEEEVDDQRKEEVPAGLVEGEGVIQNVTDDCEVLDARLGADLEEGLLGVRFIVSVGVLLHEVADLAPDLCRRLVLSVVLLEISTDDVLLVH